MNVHQRTECADRGFPGGNTQNAELPEFLFFADATFNFACDIHRSGLFGREDGRIDFFEFTDNIFRVSSWFEPSRFLQFVVSGCHFQDVLK